MKVEKEIKNGGDGMLDLENMGYVVYVGPAHVTVALSDQAMRDSGGNWVSGKVRIGDYLLIEGVDKGYLGKILEINHRVEYRRKTDGQTDEQTMPYFAKVEILLGIGSDNEPPTKGLMCYPSIGDGAYFGTKMMTDGFLRRFGLKYKQGYDAIDLGHSTDRLKTPVSVSMQSLFGRHCAIVGTTGGGKSWTIARLIGEMKGKDRSKIILLDPTGEYSAIEDEHFMSASIGVNTFFHYRYLTIEDLYYLIKPSDNIQLPKLLEAIRSLKALDLDLTGELVEYTQSGLVRKANRKKEAYEKFYYDHIGEIENGQLNFDIKYLSSQIIQECVFDTDKNHPEKYGNRNEEAVSRCFNLISRTSNLLHTEVFQKAFGFEKSVHDSTEMTRILERFLKSDKKVLRIGFEGVGFEFEAREIIANAIGIYLLGKARLNHFKENPIMVFVDEAHQFMNKSVVDDYFQASSLNAFDLIAKECRKYGLFLTIATQMPRDIPVGTLSQMGSFIVHRLINKHDKEAIISACSSASDNILEFLPILGEGEAILTGVDFPMDLTLKIAEPKVAPDSGTPKLGRVFE